MKEESNMIKKNDIQQRKIAFEWTTHFEVGFFHEGVWLPCEKAWDYEEALERKAKLEYSHGNCAICQVDIKTTKKIID